ncbi:MAG: NdvB protein [Thalassotalea sp.]|nr:NdvB protein [Thalassotalea sp.]
MKQVTRSQPVFTQDDQSVTLFSPTSMPLSYGYLYNEVMLLQLNCQGYARAQFMQPEPAKYSFAPMMEAKTFIQPEQNYFDHHPGRFFYVKDKHNQQLYSVPFAPCKIAPGEYKFSQRSDKVLWEISSHGLDFELSVELSDKLVAEYWQLTVINSDSVQRELSLYPYFSIGYQSWMNREACFDSALDAIIASSITPYQKLEEYYQNKALKDTSFLLSESTPDSWCCLRNAFEGEQGLHQPQALLSEQLPKKNAFYEDPVAAMQFDLALQPKQSRTFRFVFGAAKDRAEVLGVKKQGFAAKKGTGFTTRFNVTDDSTLGSMINTWVPNQVNYHIKLHRLSTDPQTRNLLQDAIGSCFMEPSLAKEALILALSQQQSSGEMPDGVILNANAELKYINQVPHADANIWLPILLQAYLDETNDVDLLMQQVPFADTDKFEPVYRHIELALYFILGKRDQRGLCYIEQGDWCDPLNMAGHKGLGVSSWLTMALSFSIKCWIDIVSYYGQAIAELKDRIGELEQQQAALNDAINQYCWHQDWYSRGITDEGRPFGTADDREGRIYLNPQSWALLCGAATLAKKFSLLNEVERQLNTPFGTMMLAPSYTKVQEDIGRLTQKYPGTAENGSVYNHAAIFYAYALYQVGEHNQAYQVLVKLMPNEQDILQRGQLPNFIPNYYRGAYYQLPSHAGRSSHLMNTGTVAWFYRCVIEELYGLKGRAGKLQVNPKLPDCINRLAGQREFMGANFEFVIEKASIEKLTVWLDGQKLAGNIVSDFKAGKTYQLQVKLPSL